ncbi:MAG: FeoB-associated Cys-rich membrane protein [Clostridiales bacterium]|jgi:hypothetical protein|nr:FeoB-associated Cys-rich membrane protein [Bacillota bacterium]NLL53624.1 FeoB-associated Cys-rich membrane protein [Clostridiales bacterium]
MLRWVSENLGTMLVALMLAGIVTAIVVKLRKDKKQGKSICSGNCGMCGSCPKQ